MGECGAPGDVNSNVLIAPSTGDAQLDKAVWQWLSWDKVGVWRGGRRDHLRYTRWGFSILLVCHRFQRIPSPSHPARC